jgi:hypothetical protein
VLGKTHEGGAAVSGNYEAWVVEDMIAIICGFGLERNSF